MSVNQKLSVEADGEGGLVGSSTWRSSELELDLQ